MGTPPAWSIRRVHAGGEALVEALADLLIDCVEGGASVSFMLPLTRERAAAFWRRVVDDVAGGRRALLVAEDAHGVCGTAQLVRDLPENQPHRADLVKMLVGRRMRKRGLGCGRCTWVAPPNQDISSGSGSGLRCARTSSG
jgi:hypothetical protein